jgi:3-methylcrotonyl-CoA carboxylase beta subunit
MQRIHSQIETASDSYRENREHNLRLALELREKVRAARFDRPQRAFDLLAERNKLTVRARLDLLLDPGTPFMELSPLAACEAYDGTAPQAVIVTGIGVVN